MRNPDAEAKAQFQRFLRNAITAGNIRPVPPTFLEPKTKLLIHLGFHSQRPKKHFYTSVRSPSTLTPQAKIDWPTRPDLDNEIKWVLDALEGIAYHNDSQIVELHATKQYDSLNECNGRTTIRLEMKTN